MILCILWPGTLQLWKDLIVWLIGVLTVLGLELAAGLFAQQEFKLATVYQHFNRFWIAPNQIEMQNLLQMVELKIAETL